MRCLRARELAKEALVKIRGVYTDEDREDLDILTKVIMDATNEEKAAQKKARSER